MSHPRSRLKLLALVAVLAVVGMVRRSQLAGVDEARAFGLYCYGWTDYTGRVHIVRPGSRTEEVHACAPDGVGGVRFAGVAFTGEALAYWDRPSKALRVVASAGSRIVKVPTLASDDTAVTRISAATDGVLLMADAIQHLPSAAPDRKLVLQVHLPSGQAQVVAGAIDARDGGRDIGLICETEAHTLVTQDQRTLPPTGPLEAWDYSPAGDWLITTEPVSGRLSVYVKGQRRTLGTTYARPVLDRHLPLVWTKWGLPFTLGDRARAVDFAGRTRATGTMYAGAVMLGSLSPAELALIRLLPVVGGTR